jgi:hypothetical protein
LRSGWQRSRRQSTRWIEGYERLAEQAAELPTTRLVYVAVYVADRESDIVALMVKARELGHPADRLIRSQHNRALPDGGKLWNKASAGEPLGGIHFALAARQVQPGAHGTAAGVGAAGHFAGRCRRRGEFHLHRRPRSGHPRRASSPSNELCVIK